MSEPANAWREGVARAWLLPGGRLAARLEAGAHRTPPDAVARSDREWERLRAGIPTLFDGPIIMVEQWSPERAALVCRRASYKPFAVGVRRRSDAPIVWLLAVTGLVVSRGEEGEESILFGRRGGGTWLYLDQWELAPSGGLQLPPLFESGEIPRGAFVRQLRAELGEEAGINLADDAAASLVGVTVDPAVNSLDVVVRIEVSKEAAAGEAPPSIVHAKGEYAEVRWVRRSDLGGFVGEHPGRVLPPTLAMLRVLGWIV